MKRFLKSGTWVRLKTRHWTGKEGFLLEDEKDGLVIIITDGSSGLEATREEVAVLHRQEPPHDLFPMRKRLPYGRYNCANGDIVLYNRDYEPLMRCSRNGEIITCDPLERIQYVDQDWFYLDGDPPWDNKKTLKRCIEALAWKSVNIRHSSSHDRGESAGAAWHRRISMAGG